MATQSKIQWTEHTFNPWWGCTKVNRGCQNCYAESWDKRFGGGHWGPASPRRMILTEWDKPHRWNRAAEQSGRITPVFCASMADLFERFRGDVVDQTGRKLYRTALGAEPSYPLAGHPPVTVEWLRQQTFAMIEKTPALLWLLLTKRPGNIVDLVPDHWLTSGRPRNVMYGYSASDQETLEGLHKNSEGGWRELVNVPGRHFLSLEPMHASIDLSRPLNIEDNSFGEWIPAINGAGPNVEWVIVGGESGGRKAAPCDLDWIRSVIDQCDAAGVPCFVKQIGSNPFCGRECWSTRGGGVLVDVHALGGWEFRPPPKGGGGELDHWPADIRVRSAPPAYHPTCSGDYLPH